jgi:hypothetical protein
VGYAWEADTSGPEIKIISGGGTRREAISEVVDESTNTQFALSPHLHTNKTLCGVLMVVKTYEPRSHVPR